MSGAANLLGLREAQVAALVRGRQIPFIALPGGDVRFDKADVIAWMERHKCPVPAGAADRPDRMLRDLTKR